MAPPTPTSIAAGAPPPQSTAPPPPSSSFSKNDNPTNTSSSTPPAQHVRTRTLSNAATITTATTANTNKRASIIGSPLVEHKVHYTVLVRLPFARGDFVDPAQVEWDATKDQALWKIISRPMTGGSQRKEIDWQELAARFEVGQGFILQQAAWLYERHLRHVRAQMRKVGSVGGTGASGSGAGGVPMKRGGSGGAGAGRTTSALSMRSGARDSPVPVGGGARMGAGTPVVGGQLSRTPSTTTITQSRLMQQPQSPRHPVRSSFRSSFPPAPRRASPTLAPTAEASRNQSRTVSPTSMNMSQSDSESSSTDDDKDNPIRRSQVFRRPPRFMSRPAKPGLPRLDDVDIEYDDTTDYGDRAGDERSDGDEDEDEDEFLPFAVSTRRRTTTPSTRQQGPSSTVPRRAHTHHDQHHRSVTANAPARSTDPSSARAPRLPLSSIAAGKQPVRSATMDSSFTSASDAAPGSTDGDNGGNNGPSAAPKTPTTATQGAFAARRQKLRAGTVTAAPPYSPGSGALSPRHRAELARLSPRGGATREGSEGTPSMGSSFSDLDDASITQSALEEQLLSHMQHQGGLSKMSTISQALRSRYLP
ncbi:hypothetical protein B0J12DRAFT_409289 [Macrophomina phaseolina]|uniref:Autophagy-related protein 29 n=1 Tax=Macrophomina phaseolina TaxID=35725 RepID=A0ABQ8GJ42_9PEZI|nr:hypothetical protein B0J12DRAFT_409289 [Macrophomina phaseolina]